SRHPVRRRRPPHSGPRPSELRSTTTSPPRRAELFSTAHAPTFPPDGAVDSSETELRTGIGSEDCLPPHPPCERPSWKLRRRRGYGGAVGSVPALCGSPAWAPLSAPCSGLDFGEPERGGGPRAATGRATQRLKQDYLRIKKDPVPYICAEPLPSNILEWHYVVRGPEMTPYEGKSL
ncbi:hypothetical protein MC885_019401, partial [Smutsia gigantea]